MEYSSTVKKALRISVPADFGLLHFNRCGRGVRDAYPHCCIYVDVPGARYLTNIDIPEQYAALLQTEAEQA